jgi:SAM-dependent methyltransferase
LVCCAVPVVFALRSVSRRPLATAAVLLAAALGMGRTEELAAGVTPVKRLRNYYGVYKIYDRDGLRYLQHGTTQHGRQYLGGPKRDVPLAYFHPTTPAAGVLRSGAFPLRSIGMIGLGTGALAAYAGEGQSFTVYELDPDNLPLAETYFSYLEQARARGARLDVVFGDGRVTVRELEPDSLDLLIIDAFNSGSIPVHLLTVEAFGDYFRALRAGGLLLLHVSNKVLDLTPVVYANAAALGAGACEQNNEGRVHPDAELTYWAAVSFDRAALETLTGRLGWWRRDTPAQEIPAPWTDQYSNVFGAMF